MSGMLRNMPYRRPFRVFQEKLGCVPMQHTRICDGRYASLSLACQVFVEHLPPILLFLGFSHVLFTPNQRRVLRNLCHPMVRLVILAEAVVASVFLRPLMRQMQGVKTVAGYRKCLETIYVDTL